MATLVYQLPTLFIPESQKSIPPSDIPPGAGHTGLTLIQEADFVVVAAGVTGRASTNSATIAGYALAAETAALAGTSTAWTYGAYNALPYGYLGNQTPKTPTYVPVIKLDTLFVDINVSQVTGWQTGGTYQANYGTTGGLLLVTTGNYNTFVFDPSQTNAIMTIVDKPQGPGQGIAGDLGARVRVKFSAASLTL